MAISVASLQARLSADVKSFSTALQQAQQELDRLGRSGQQADAGLGRANGALVHLERDLKPARTSMGHMHGATNDLGKGLNTLTAAAMATGGPFGAMSGRLMGLSMLARDMNVGTLLLVGGLGAAALALTKTASAGLEAHIQMQKIDSALRVGTGSSEAAAEAYDFVRSEARRLGLELDTSAQQFGKLSAAARGTSLEGEGARRIFSAAAEAATVLGLSASDTSGMLKAFEQMISKGKVQAEELRGQLGERLPGAFNMAARAMGVTTAELNKMLDEGKVGIDLLPKLADEMHKTFGPEAVKAAGNLQQSINKVSTEFFELKAITGAFLAEGAGPLLTWLADFARGLNEVSAVKGVASALLAEEHVTGLRQELAMLEGLASRGQTRLFDVGSLSMVNIPQRTAELRQFLKAYEFSATSIAQATAKARSGVSGRAAPVEITDPKAAEKMLKAFKDQLSELSQEVQLGDRSLADYLAILQAYVPGMTAAAATSEQGADALRLLRLEIQKAGKEVRSPWLVSLGEMDDRTRDFEDAMRDAAIDAGELRHELVSLVRGGMADYESGMQDLVPVTASASFALSGNADIVRDLDRETADFESTQHSLTVATGGLGQAIRANTHDVVEWQRRLAVSQAQQRRDAGDYTGFIVAQFRLQAVEARTTWDGIADAVRDATSAMSSTLSDGFFEFFTTGTINAGDLFEDFTKRMARSLANFLADAAVRGFLGFALGLAGGGTIFRIGGGGTDRIPALLSPGETILSTGQTGVLGSILKSAGLVPEGAGGNIVNTAIGTALERLGATNAATNISQGGLAGALFGLPEVPGFFEFPGQAATPGLLGASGTVGQTGMTLSALAKNVAGVAGVFGGLSGVLAAQTEGGQLGAAVALTGAVAAAMGNPILGAGLALVGALMPGLFGDDDWAQRRAGRYAVGADTLRSAFGALDAGDLTASAGNMRVGDLVYTMAVEQMDNAFARNLEWPANAAFTAIRDRFGAAGFAHGAFSVGDVGSLGELISFSGRAPYEGVAAWEDLLRGVTAQITGATLASIPITQLAPFTDPAQALSNATELPIDLAAAAFTEQRFGLPGFTVDPGAPFGLRSLDVVEQGFAEGGVVPGAIGEPQLAVVHGGEEVLTPEQRGGRGGSVLVVQLVTPDRRVLAEQVIEGIKILDSVGHKGIPSSFVYTRRRN